MIEETCEVKSMDGFSLIIQFCILFLVFLLSCIDLSKGTAASLIHMCECNNPCSGIIEHKSYLILNFTMPVNMH